MTICSSLCCVAAPHADTGEGHQDYGIRGEDADFLPDIEQALSVQHQCTNAVDGVC